MAAWVAATSPASQASSSSYVSWTTARTAPWAARLGGLERAHLRELGVERRREPVGDLEDAAVGAAVHRERRYVGTSGEPPAAGKSWPKPRMLETEAPRQP